jgi:uncharacterized SAM-binding protein YcdF (DUF218 family)
VRFSRRARVVLSGFLAGFLLLLTAAFLFRGAWLSWLGACLVEHQEPVRSDMLVVLGGDMRGGRILKAAGLACQGYAPRVLVSGSGPIYGQHESDLAVAWAVSQGFDEKLFLRLHYPAQSTEDEAAAVTRELRRLRVHRFLLVTSSFHTRRATRIFHRAAPDLSFRVVESPDPYFTPDGWWKTREGQKTFLTEWSKTLANWLGD